MSQGRACSLRFAPHFKLRLILPKRALTQRCLLIPRAPSAPHSSPHTFSALLFKSFFKTPIVFKSISSAAASPPSSQLLGAKFVVQMPLWNTFEDHGLRGLFENWKYRLGLSKTPPSVYTGCVGENDNRPHGQGVLTLSNLYEDGQFHGGKLHGQGTRVMFLFGKWFYTLVGQFHQGRPHGECRLLFSSGELKEGRFENGEFTQGQVTFPNGDVYVGQFQDDFQHGSGIMTRADGAIEKGAWIAGKGPGVTGLASVENRQPHSDSTQRVEKMSFLWSGGGVYSGSVIRSSNQEHGAGCREFADGDVQEGEFHHGELHGYGRYKYASGSVYIGHFVAGKRSGKGQYIGCLQDDDDIYYVGEWQNDLQHGWGAQVNRDLSRHVGEFKDGHVDGDGTLTHADGRIVTGIWRHGILQQQSQS